MTENFKVRQSKLTKSAEGVRYNKQATKVLLNRREHVLLDLLFILCPALLLYFLIFIFTR